MHKIALRILGVDDADDLAKLHHLGRRGQYSIAPQVIDGRMLAVVFPISEKPLDAAVDAARAILLALKSAIVDGVDPEIVGLTDVAHRVRMTREAVRLWIKGERGPGRFPPPVASIARGEQGSSTPLWSWPAVSAWLSEHYGMIDEYEHLTAVEVAELTIRLHHLNQEYAGSRAETAGS